MQPNLAAPEAASQSGHVSRDIGYRPDVDGLRAIAVMLVVLNHAGVVLMSGGFIGVDVFFVISGFLITALIAVQRHEERFSFGAFYLRRAKRLLPALYVLMLVVMVAGYWPLIPSDYTLLTESALSAVALASNLFFWLHTGGYFSPDASSFPLLHIWSLSLEEQFYLIWPAALLVLLRLRSPAARIGLVALTAALSFAYAQNGVQVHSVGSYFLLPARGGEFLVGALVYMLSRACSPNTLLANAASALGLLLVLGSSVLLNAHSPFPGIAALVPCLGSAFIIAAPQFGPSLTTRLLSTRPFAFVGLISYSVYLWHWPIVSFLWTSRVAITPAITIGIVAASLLLGAASWWLLERTYRGLLDRRNGAALAIGAVVTAALLVIPIYVYRHEGLPGRFPYALLTQDQLTAERNRYWIDLPSKDTTLGNGGGKQLLIVGNSHAYDLAYALNENGYPGKVKLIETFYQCFNFGHQAVLPTDAPFCAQRLQAVLTSNHLQAADVVYLHDDWGGYDEAGLLDMINRLRAVTKAPIYVFGPKMTFTDLVLSISKQAQSQHFATVIGINGFAAQFQNPEKLERDRQLKAFFQFHQLAGVHYISTLDVQCGPRLACDMLSPAGQYLYFDSSHFTLEGSRRFGQHLKALYPELF
jgi:peptidoglycan/LPS O-acetylase OafA/YrhL